MPATLTTHAELPALEPNVLEELLRAIDDRLETVSTPAARARLDRGRIRLELELADALVD